MNHLESRDHPSPIDLWVQGLATYFLVPSPSSIVCVSGWEGGWNTKTKSTVALIPSLLGSATVLVASQYTHLASLPRWSYTGAS